MFKTVKMAHVHDIDPVVVIDDSMVNKNSTLDFGADSGLVCSRDLSASTQDQSTGDQSAGPHASVLSSISGLNVGRVGEFLTIKIWV